jgi:hypothetical protein
LQSPAVAMRHPVIGCAVATTIAPFRLRERVVRTRVGVPVEQGGVEDGVAGIVPGSDTGRRPGGLGGEVRHLGVRTAAVEDDDRHGVPVDVRGVGVGAQRPHRAWVGHRAHRVVGGHQRSASAGAVDCSGDEAPVGGWGSRHIGHMCRPSGSCRGRQGA